MYGAPGQPSSRRGIKWQVVSPDSLELSFSPSVADVSPAVPRVSLADDLQVASVVWGLEVSLTVESLDEAHHPGCGSPMQEG